MDTFFIFTSFSDRNQLLNGNIANYNYSDNGETIEFPDYDLKIVSDEGYFTQQREGMLNFFSSLMNPNHMEVHGKFLMHLSSCIQGYKIICSDASKATPLLNALIDNLHGLIFTPDMTFYLKDWKVLINTSGDCEVTDYDVKMSASTFDDLNTTATDAESENRKQNSISYIESLGIRTLDSLPTIPSSSQVTYRSESEVVKRILCLAAVAVKGELRSNEIPYNVMNKYEITPNDLSPKELDFMQDVNIQEQDFVNATWRYESLNVLMWAMGYIDDLYFPSEIVDVASLTDDIRQCDDFYEFSASANMRDLNEILDQLDLTYRLHWACTDARVNNEEIPSNLNASVIYERHYALNWLINLYGEEWDDVSTNT